jgi:hypothetical protein
VLRRRGVACRRCLQTWGIYLSQFWGRMSVLYSKGSKIDCPDALSRLRYELSEQSAALRDWASRLGKEPDTAEFEVTEAFAVTRSSRKAQTQVGHIAESDTLLPTDAANTPKLGIAEKTETAHRTSQQGLAIVPSEACKEELQQAVQNSAHFSAIYKRLLESDKTIVDGHERYELPETCCNGCDQSR